MNNYELIYLIGIPVGYIIAFVAFFPEAVAAKSNLIGWEKKHPNLDSSTFKEEYNWNLLHLVIIPIFMGLTWPLILVFIGVYAIVFFCRVALDCLVSLFVKEPQDDT